MADNQEHTDRRVFWLLAGLSAMAFVYVFAVTFIPVPENNLRFVDTSIGFILGTVLAGCLQYYTGATAGSGKKATTPEGTTTANISAEITTNPKEDGNRTQTN